MSELPIGSLTTRHYDQVITMIDRWWEGRPMAAMLPRLFFSHFSDTSFAVEDHGRCVAFLAGFLSQTFPARGYIHFVGVDPLHRQKALGRRLYEHFAAAIVQRGGTSIHAVTSPANTASLAFHRRLGFEVVPSSVERDGLYVHPAYDGPGEDRVLLRRDLFPAPGVPMHDPL